MTVFTSTRSGIAAVSFPLHQTNNANHDSLRAVACECSAGFLVLLFLLSLMLHFLKIARARKLPLLIVPG